ncbi:MAG: hypothetical protein C5B58_08875 [Acidobacteria bacterium]|nr:MAG: hypothetical protein C5B58_08875 [Acidobacteriota bacterium]
MSAEENVSVKGDVNMRRNVISVFQRSLHFVSAKVGISAKLGRCAFCMGFALGGAVIGWAAFAAVVSFWPGFPFLNLLTLLPISFTAIWLLHIATFGARVVASKRRERPGVVMSRLRVVGVFASGLGLAILASAVAAPRVLAGGGPCCDYTGDCPSDHQCNPGGCKNKQFVGVCSPKPLPL